MGLVYDDSMKIEKVRIPASRSEFTFTAAKPREVLIDPRVNLLYEGEDRLVEVKVKTTSMELFRTWELSQVNGRPVAGEGTPTLKLRVDNTLQGNAGCNNYQGSFSVKGKKLIINEQISTTRMACEEMALEDEFLQVLGGGSFIFAVTDDRLQLKQKGVPILIFKAEK